MLAVLVIILVTAASAVIVSGANRGGVARFLHATDDIFVPGDEITADPAGRQPAPGEARVTPDGTEFGPSEGPRTLVLFDPSGEYGASQELAALNAAMLATHFGPVTTLDVSRYRAGRMHDFKAMLYVGANESTKVPAALATDVLSGKTPVLWAGANLEQVAATALTRFRTAYGWDPTRPQPKQPVRPDGVRYKGQVIKRNAKDNPLAVRIPSVTDPSKITVLAEALCGAKPCGGAAASSPWAFRSANLTYVGEVPFAYTKENDRYLVYADLLYDLLAPDAEPIRQAAVRLEDVSPIANPDDIRRYADYLSGEGIPFQIAVIPRYLDPHGVFNEGRRTSVTLKDAPRVVDALKYAQSKGGILIQHGTTHQLSTLDNPYNGVTADDYEFFRAICSTEPPSADIQPADQVDCETDTPVHIIGPPTRDTVTGARMRIQHGRDLFVEAGLGTPTIFETPHYAASSNAYRAMRQLYEIRYSRDEYPDGLLTGKPSKGKTLGMRVPFRAMDPYGSVVLPENVGNYAPVSYSGHEVRDTKLLVSNARANLVVRESTASFFFHPFLPVERLAEIVDGIRDLGYTFVPAAELR